MTVPLTSSLAAYMMVTNTIVPSWHIVLWMSVMSLIGVLIAFPLKRRFINEDQLPFPEGRACGVILDALYHGAAGEGIFKAKVLGITAALTGFYQFLVSDGLQRLVQFKLLRVDKWLGWTAAWHFRERIDEYYYMRAATRSGLKIGCRAFRKAKRRSYRFLDCARNDKGLRTVLGASSLPDL